MSKRLILILALAFVVGVSFAAYAEVQNVKVSGDVTVLGVMRELSLQHTANEDRDKDQSLASIIRLRTDADLTDNVSATVRLLNERYWGTETDNTGVDNNPNSDISLDLAYVSLKEFLYSPLSLMVGRQELHFGNEMIVGDPDTNNQVTTASAFSSANTADADLSARKAFDSIRATLNYDPLVVDIIAAKIDENTKNTQDDQDLYGINANYALSKNTSIEGYYFLKYTARETAAPPKPDRVDTIGARIASTPIEDLTLSLEGAFQFGSARARIDGTAFPNNDVVKRRAFAAEVAAIKTFSKLMWTPTLTLGSAYFSGQKANDTKKNRAWDPMFENQKFGDIANAQFDQSNAVIAMAHLAVKPINDVTLKGEYYAFWWDKKYGDLQRITSRRGDTIVMRHNKFAGQELDLKATYDYTEDVQFGLLAGLLVPGEAFDKQTDHTATEVIGSMKVTF